MGSTISKPRVLELVQILIPMQNIFLVNLPWVSFIVKKNIQKESPPFRELLRLFSYAARRETSAVKISCTFIVLLIKSCECKTVLVLLCAITTLLLPG